MKTCISVNKKIYTLIFFMFLFVPSLFAANYFKLSDQIVNTYDKQFAKPRGLHLSAQGGAMMDDIKKVILNFKSCDALTIDEARVLYVEMMEEFLCRVNQNEKIRPYLHNYPFEPHNFGLTIGFRNTERKITDDGHVALMFIGKNQQLRIAGYNPETEQFYSLHREPYQESLKIVQQARNE